MKGVTSRTESYLIRPFRIEDAAAVHELASSTPEAGHWALGSYKQLIEEGQQGWVEESTGGVNGFLVVRIIPPEMEVLNVVVAADSRRRGVAAALFAAAEKEACDKKVSRIFLEVRESNAAAIAFYDRRGFRKIGQRAGYYRDPLEAAILMEMAITL